jgi:hypothetical protein
MAVINSLYCTGGRGGTSFRDQIQMTTRLQSTEQIIWVSAFILSKWSPLRRLYSKVPYQFLVSQTLFTCLVHHTIAQQHEVICIPNEVPPYVISYNPLTPSPLSPHIFLADFVFSNILCSLQGGH